MSNCIFLDILIMPLNLSLIGLSSFRSACVIGPEQVIYTYFNLEREISVSIAVIFVLSVLVVYYDRDSNSLDLSQNGC